MRVDVAFRKPLIFEAFEHLVDSALRIDAKRHVDLST